EASQRYPSAPGRQPRLPDDALAGGRAGLHVPGRLDGLLRARRQQRPDRPRGVHVARGPAQARRAVVSVRAAFALLVLTVGWADRPVEGPYRTSRPPVATDAAVGPGDFFDVRVYGEPALSSNYEVAPDGTINFPLIGTVQVEGKTPPAIEKEIQERLAAG